MLHELLAANRDEILARTQTKMAARGSNPTRAEMRNGFPLFLHQLGESLRLSLVSSDALERSAAEHGGDLLRAGYTLSQVVHGYGDVCEAITELVYETNASLTPDDLHTLNRSLDDAIAQAVTEYARQRERALADAEAERLRVLKHDLRNHLNAGMLAFEMLKVGNVGIPGSITGVLGRSLSRLNDLLGRPLVMAPRVPI